LSLRFFRLAVSTNHPSSDFREVSNFKTEQGFRSASLLGSLLNYSLLGGGAALLLAIVELLDLNVTLTPIFQSLFERLLFGSYFSLNLIEGLIIGLCVGIFVHMFLFV